ncbi:uncharacterized protein VP01_4299g1 [Puccinia sorghi]|uniref:Uncharacterized protein n=1 Tax=Puccinia sorghi TaxID=27349 RepID=A0A0L6UQ63_9BASI|nr:uncharacterized protein VP01_4299g1 [Puccinia sorghi]
MANVRNHVRTPRQQELKKLFELEKSCRQVKMIQSRNFQMDVRSFDKPAAIMIIGYLHNIISQKQYGKVHALVAIFNLHLPHWTNLFKNKASVCERLNIQLNESISVFGNKCFSLGLKDILSWIQRVWTSTSYINLRSGVRNSQWKFESKLCPFQETISISMSLPNCSMELWLYLFSSIHFMGNCIQNESDLELMDMSLGKTSNFWFHILFHTIWIKIFQNGFNVADFFANSMWGEGWVWLYVRNTLTNRKFLPSEQFLEISTFIWNQIKFPNPWRVKANGREIFPNNGTNTYHTTAHLQACHLLKTINNKIVTFCQHLKRLDGCLLVESLYKVLQYD